MTWQGIKVPLLVILVCWSLIFSLLANFILAQHEIGLILMRLYSDLWVMMDFNASKLINLELPSGNLISIPMGAVPYNSAVEVAVAKGLRMALASVVGAAFLTVPITIWFIELSRKRGTEILLERHERGAMLVERAILAEEIADHNRTQLIDECSKVDPPMDPQKVERAPILVRIRRGIHVPYTIAGVQYPWRLEQSHTMLIGTTGAGKTTQLRRTVAEARARGHSSVIFDLTGAFVESFYNPETDTILNPMDVRCPPWTIFNECENYADFMSAAEALIPASRMAESHSGKWLRAHCSSKCA